MIKENQRALNQINGLTDALILFPCMAFAYFIRFDLFHGIPGHVGLSYYMTTILCMAPLFWLICNPSICLSHLFPCLKVKSGEEWVKR